MTDADKQQLNDNVVLFFSGKRAFRSLSNFSDHFVRLEDRFYITGEHCFHGEKFRLIGLAADADRGPMLLEHSKRFEGTSPSIASPTEAKRQGGKKGFLLTMKERMAWEAASEGVQRCICVCKTRDHPEVRKDLLSSGNRLLVHPALRCSVERAALCVWEGRAVVIDGRITVIGGNGLGRLYMECREQLCRPSEKVPNIE